MRKKSLIRLQSTKKPSKITTFQKILRNNPDIFSFQYPTSENEPIEHYISKIYLGEKIKNRFVRNWNTYFEFDYEYNDLPQIKTSKGHRTYYPDILLKKYEPNNKIIKICNIEINGGIHYKNKERIEKNYIRRDAITNYFTNQYRDPQFPDWRIVFSYIVFKDEDFLYHRLEDFHFKEFNFYFNNGGRYPEFLVGG